MAKSNALLNLIRPKAEEVRKSIKSNVSEEIKNMLEIKEMFLLHSIRDCESPIEQLFCLHLMDVFEYHESKFRAIDSDVTIGILIQKEVEYHGKKYRPDFIINVHALGKDFDFIVECDGHDFHEKTKEQAKRDKSRDRDLQSVGFRIIRFTGSEIWKDPSQCVFQTYQFIETVTGLEEKYFKEHFPFD